LISFRVFSW